MSDYTNNWFAYAPEVWQHLTPLLKERRSFLEIGSYEGRSTVWTIENMLEDGGRIDCIDTWEGSEEHDGTDMAAVEARFDKNTYEATSNTKFRRQVRKLKGRATEKLAYIMTSRVSFYDFVYIDGSHVARDVLTDACMAWTMLKPGGIMVFDDYLWGDKRDVLHRPKLAIDAFVNIFAEDLTVLHVGNQLAIMRNPV